MKKGIVGFVIAGLSVFAITTAQTANAQTAYLAPSGTYGNQSLANIDLGMNFSVNAPIDVTALGAFDNGTADFNQPIEVAIFSLDGGTEIASATFDGLQSNVVGDDAFAVITPTELDPGWYQIDAFGYGTGDGATLNYNAGFDGTTYVPPYFDPNVGDSFTNTEDIEANDPANLTFGSNGYYSASVDGVTLATTEDGGAGDRYDAGTFQYAPAPEANTVIGFGVMLLAGAALPLAKKRTSAKA